MSRIDEIKSRYNREIEPHEGDRGYWEGWLSEAFRREHEGEADERFIVQLARLFLDDSSKSSVNVGFVGEWREAVQLYPAEIKEIVWQAYSFLMALQRNSYVRTLNISGTVRTGEESFNREIQDILTTKLSWKYETIAFERFDFDARFDDTMSELPIEKPVKHLSFVHCLMHNMQPFARPEIMETLETLSLQSCVLYDTTGLAELIRNAKNLKRLTLKNLKLDHYMAQQLAYVLSQHQTLEHVEMDSVSTAEPLLPRILNAVEGVNQLRRLIIKDVACSGATGQMLESFLVRNSSLVELRISASPLLLNGSETQLGQPAGLSAENDVSKWERNRNFSLQKINLNLLEAMSAIALLKLTYGCQALYSLTASGSDIPAVFNTKPNTCFVLRYLYEINFSHCGLRKDDMHAIKSLLIISGCIHTLTFTGEPIEGGLGVIVAGITTNVSLKFLNLINTQLNYFDRNELKNIAALKPGLRIFTGLYPLTEMYESYRQEISKRKMISDAIGFDQDHATLEEVLNYITESPSEGARGMVKRLTFMGPDALRVTSMSRESVASTIVHASSGERKQCSVM